MEVTVRGGVVIIAPTKKTKSLQHLLQLYFFIPKHSLFQQNRIISLLWMMMEISSGGVVL